MSSNQTNTTLNPTQIFSNTLSAISHQFIWYMAIIVTPMGIIGNLISLFIYTRAELNKKTNG